MDYKELCKIVDSSEVMTLYHGLKPSSLEYALSEGALIPRVCAEGGPKAVYFCEYPLEYPCVVAIDVPKDMIGWSGKFEPYANRQYITRGPVGVDEYNFRLVKWGSWCPEDSEDLNWWRQIWRDDDKLNLLKVLLKRFDEYPCTWQWIIEKYLEA